MTPAEYDEHVKNIDTAVVVLLDLLKWGSGVFPQLAVAAPVLSMFIKYEANKIKSGLANGKLIPDQQHGYVPITNSTYNAKTGRFTSGPFSE